MNGFLLYLSRIGFVAYLVWSAFYYLLRHTIFGRLLWLLLPISLAALWIFRPLGEAPPMDRAILLQVPAGANFRQVADSLVKHEALAHKTLFLALGKLSGKEKLVRAGLFEVPRGLSTWQLLNYLRQAPARQIKVTFPEGSQASDMARRLAAVGIDSLAFMTLVTDSAFAASLVPGERSLHGYLLPETYHFEWKSSAESVLRHMVANTLAIFSPDSVQAHLSVLGYSRREVLILASIIEGEALIDSERVIISSLYHNRLRLGMRLQADPTIQYALPGPPRRLLLKDLEYDSPYNTYRYAGLPPGPINNPGRQSILAALYPANTSYLYMVASGDGGHRFSRTLREHNYWHRRFNEVRRQIRRRQRQPSR